MNFASFIKDYRDFYVLTQAEFGDYILRHKMGKNDIDDKSVLNLINRIEKKGASITDPELRKEFLKIFFYIDLDEDISIYQFAKQFWEILEKYNCELDVERIFSFTLVPELDSYLEEIFSIIEKSNSLNSMESRTLNIYREKINELLDTFPDEILIRHIRFDLDDRTKKFKSEEDYIANYIADSFNPNKPAKFIYYLAFYYLKAKAKQSIETFKKEPRKKKNDIDIFENYVQIEEKIWESSEFKECIYGFFKITEETWNEYDVKIKARYTKLIEKKLNMLIFLLSQNFAKDFAKEYLSHLLFLFTKENRDSNENYSHLLDLSTKENRDSNENLEIIRNIDVLQKLFPLLLQMLYTLHQNTYPSQKTIDTLSITFEDLKPLFKGIYGEEDGNLMIIKIEENLQSMKLDLEKEDLEAFINKAVLLNQILRRFKLIKDNIKQIKNGFSGILKDDKAGDN